MQLENALHLRDVRGRGDYHSPGCHLVIEFEWAQPLPAAPIAHASGPVSISRICGPVAQTSPDTFAIRFGRMGITNQKRSNEIWLLASHPGDATFKRAVQQAVLHFPLRNIEGAPQRITFPEVADQPKGVASVKLEATSDAGAAVNYYVLAGPAEIEGDVLKLTSLPPRSKFPLKVTVVAWQWGRSIEPRLQTAEPVERTFSVIAPIR